METDFQTCLRRAVAATLGRRKRAHPCHVNRISQMGHPCERYLYYCRTAWELRAPTSDDLQGVFETGNILEPVIGRIITEVGEAANPPFRIVGQQMPTKDDLLKRHNIAGTIDGFFQVLRNGSWTTSAVVDVKTANPNIFRSLEDVDSLNKYRWTRRYRAQLMLYALAHDLDQCFILFVNKSNLWQVKLIDFPLDYGYAESLIQKADRVNQAVATGEPPAKLNQPDECGQCDFAGICAPELTSKEGIELSDDSELEEMLVRRQELLPAKKELATIEKRISELVPQGQNVACGDFLVLWTRQIRKEYRVPAGEHWRKRIILTGGER